MRTAVRVLTVVLLLAVVSAAAAGALAVQYNRAPGATPDDPFFRVQAGDSVSAIASRLEERGFIRSRLAFVLYVKLMKTEKNLQRGFYRIPAGTTLVELHDLLLRGKQYLVSVTIPEGYTLSGIAALMEENNIVSADNFIAAAESPELLQSLNIPGKTAEGYLFPDTYRLALDTPADTLLKHLVSTFFRKIEVLGVVYSDYTPEEFHDRIILASIVEREYRVADEAPLIASVFLNRLKLRMPLQSCATVVYVLTEQLGHDHPSFLTYRDLEVDSPYNTYKHYGLPPEPICNPGTVSLKAAFFPADSDYLYFVLESPQEGRHKFTTTLSEHNAAKRLYIKKRN